MNSQSIPAIIMASICFYVGTYHLIIYIRRPQSRQDLTFALTCLSIGLYDIFCAGLYNTTSPENGVQWQRAQIITLAMASIGLIWFVTDYTKQTSRRLVLALSGCYFVCGLIILIERSELTWSSQPTVKNISLLFGMEVSYFEMMPGPIVNITSLLGVVIFGYSLWAGVRMYRSGDQRKAVPLIVAIVIIFIGVFNDTVVASGFLQFVYLIEYAFLALVLFMAYTLSSEVVRSLEFQEALQQSEERYRLIAENVADVIWTMDMMFRFNYVSPSIYQQRGYTVNEAMVQSMNEVILPSSLEKVINLYNEKIMLIEAGDPEGWEPVIFEIEQYCKDGTTIRTSNNARILPDQHKQPASILGISRDITEQKKTQQLMIQTEKMMSVGGLAAGMAHELNNPLGGMLQGAQNVQRRLSLDLKANQKAAEETGVDLKKLQFYLEKRGIISQLDGIRDAGTKTTQIISNMLQFSRKSESLMAPTNLPELMDSVLELAGKEYNLKKKYDFRDIKIIKDFEPNLPPVSITETEIEQVILNLLNNAGWAMSEDKQPQIVLRLTLEDEIVRIEVEDNGPGMDKETRKQIFEPFFTTKPVGEGTGLGLSVSYMIITNNHKGTMEVESVLGKGTKFIIKLPLNRDLPA